MNFLVTGATSMLGERLCQKLSSNSRVYAVVRKEKRELARKNITIINCNMSQYKNIAEKVKENIDVAILLAWEGTRGEGRNNLEIQERNFYYNMELIEALEKLNVKKIILAGSQAEYGIYPKNVIVDEEIISNPTTQYGKYKLKFYLECKKRCDLKGIVLIEPRIFSLYGPGDYENSLVISVLKKMLNNKDCNLTECNQLWNFLYIDDAVEAMMELIMKNCEAGVYNLASQNTRELKEFIEEMYIVTQSKSKLNYGEIKYTDARIVHLNPSVERICSLGWREKTKFGEGIKNIIKSLCE